jgi:hypothetical protein
MVSFAYSYLSRLERCCAIMEVCRRKGSTGTSACAVVGTGKNAASAILVVAAKPENRTAQSFERFSVNQLDLSHVACSCHEHTSFVGRKTRRAPAHFALCYKVGPSTRFLDRGCESDDDLTVVLKWVCRNENYGPRTRGFLRADFGLRTVCAKTYKILENRGGHDVIQRLCCFSKDGWSYGFP